MVIRSKLKLHDIEVKYLIRENIPSVHCNLELRNGELVRVYAVHPKPPFPDEDTSSTERDAELLLVGRLAKDDQRPTIVVGDLNDVAWSHTTRLFQRISGLLDPRRGRGFFSTFNAKHWWMRWPLDHVFMSVDFQLRSLRRLESIGSDHFPIFISLAHLPRKKGSQSEQMASSSDRVEAKNKIERGESGDSR